MRNIVDSPQSTRASTTTSRPRAHWTGQSACASAPFERGPRTRGGDASTQPDHRSSHFNPSSVVRACHRKYTGGA
eukprot:1423974-Prymnesium_polylepis.1